MAQYAKAAQDIAPVQLRTELDLSTFVAKIAGLETHEVSPGGDRTSVVHTLSDLSGSEQTELDTIFTDHTPV